MATNEKSGQQPEHSSDEHFAKRRKILGGLAGAPVFLTFSPHAGAQVESFARCVSNELAVANEPPTTDLSNYGYVKLDQNGIELYKDECGTKVAMLSAVCLTSFVSGGGTLPTTECRPNQLSPGAPPRKTKISSTTPRKTMTSSTTAPDK